MKTLQLVKSNQGSVLVTVLAMLVVLVTLSGSIMNIVSNEYVLSKRSLAWNQALMTAETGVEFGWNELNKLTAINTNGNFMASGTWSVVSAGIWQTTSAQTLSPMVGSEASTTYTVTVNTNTWTITSMGTASSSMVSADVSRTVVVTANPTTPFEWAMLSKGMIDFNGKNPIVDSYLSSSGPYDASTNRRMNGTVGTNNNTLDGGGAQIYGSIVTGPSGTVSGSPVIYTDSTARNQPNEITNGLEVYIPEVSAPWVYGSGTSSYGAVTTTAATALSVSGGGVAAYEMTDVATSMSFTGSGTILVYLNSIAQNGADGITITPDPGANLQVIFYAITSINITGNAGNNVGGKPFNLLFYGLPTCTTVDLGGTSSTSASVYAPNANVTIHGTADFYGSLVASTITDSGTPNFHYDEDMDTYGEILGFSLVSWREQ
jgi:Tfp pilus assembly protein PilX